MKKLIGSLVVLAVVAFSSCGPDLATEFEAQGVYTVVVLDGGTEGADAGVP